MNKYLSSANFSIGIIAVMLSSFASGKRFTIAVPLAVLPDSGIS